MKITIDTSAIIAVLFNEQHKAAIIAITQGGDLIAPHSLHWELGNSLSAMFKRKRINIQQAITALEIYSQIPIRFIESEIVEAVGIAFEKDIYAYDAYMLSIALKTNSPLLTLDSALKETAITLGVELLEI